MFRFGKSHKVTETSEPQHSLNGVHRLNGPLVNESLVNGGHRLNGRGGHSLNESLVNGGHRLNGLIG